MKQAIPYILLIFICIFLSCGKDEMIFEKNPTEIKIYGIVTDQISKSPLEGVRLSFNNLEVFTDRNGYFDFGNQTISSDCETIRLSLTDYFKSFRSICSRGSSSYALNIPMTKKKLVGIYSSESTNSISIEEDGPTITIEQYSLVNESGTLYFGDYSVYGHWYNPNSSDFINTIPSSLNGLNSENQRVQLATFGMVAFEIYGDQGQALNLGSSKSSTLRTPLNPNIVNSPTVIPLWSLDEQTGIWIEEGKAKKVGDYYAGELSHFSFWNFDLPFEFVSLRGRIINRIGEPVTDLKVRVSIANSAVSAVGATDNEGFFFGYVPRNETLDITLIDHCDEELFTKSIGPSSEDILLEDIALNMEEIGHFILEGQFLSCDGFAIEKGYLLLKDGEDHFLNIAIEDGRFNADFIVCNEFTGSIQAVNTEDYTSSPITPIEINKNGSADIGVLFACQTVEDFLSCMSPNGLYNTDVIDLDLVSDGSYVLSFPDLVYGTNIMNELVFDPALENLSKMNFQLTETLLFSCDDGFGSTCSNLSLEISHMPEQVGDFLVARITGSVSSAFGFDFNVDINFKATLRERLNSVSGQSWKDVNGDGIRNELDQVVSPIEISFISDKTGYERKSYIREEHTYIAYLPKNEVYAGLLTHGIHLIPSLEKQGEDPTVDSDFDANGTVHLETFDEDISNIDIGFKDSNEFFLEIKKVLPVCDEGYGCLTFFLPNFYSSDYSFTLVLNEENHGSVQTGYEVCFLEKGVHNIFATLDQTNQVFNEIAELLQTQMYYHNDCGLFNIDCVEGIMHYVYCLGHINHAEKFESLWFDVDNNAVDTGFCAYLPFGDYTNQVIGQGCTFLTEHSIGIYAERTISGLVWEDDPLYNPNIKDVEEVGVNDIQIELYNSQNELIDVQETNVLGEFRFYFNAIEFETFYLSIKKEERNLVIKDFGNDSEISSEADPDTGNTDFFDMTMCDRMFYFGLLKE